MMEIIPGETEYLSNPSWEKINYSGITLPKPSSYHTCVLHYVNKKVYLFGGRIKETRWAGGSSSDLFSLDLSSHYWQYIKAKPKDGNRKNLPAPREEHSAVLNEDNMVIFGGYVGDEISLIEAGFGYKMKRTNEMFSYNISENIWEKVKYKSKRIPCPRSGHSVVNKLVKVNNEYAWLEEMYVFGGKSDYDSRLNDLWKYEFAFCKWTEIKVDWAPSPRSGHSASIFHKDYMILFGGIEEITKECNDIYYFHFDTLKWFTLFEHEPFPSRP